MQKTAIHWLGFVVRRADVRETIDAALEGNPNYYVSDLSINTDTQGTIMFTMYIAMMLPRVTIEFDVVEALPR